MNQSTLDAIKQLHEWFVAETHGMWSVKHPVGSFLAREDQIEPAPAPEPAKTPGQVAAEKYLTQLSSCFKFAIRPGIFWWKIDEPGGVLEKMREMLAAFLDAHTAPLVAAERQRITAKLRERARNSSCNGCNLFLWAIADEITAASGKDAGRM